MILRGRMIDANEAGKVGLVSEICPLGDLKKRAQELGEELAKQPRLAVRGMLNTLVGFETKTLQQSIKTSARRCTSHKARRMQMKACLRFLKNANRNSIRAHDGRHV